MNYDIQRIQALLSECDDLAASNAARGRALETLVSELFELIPGVTVEARDSLEQPTNARYAQATFALGAAQSPTQERVLTPQKVQSNRRTRGTATLGTGQMGLEGGY